MKQVLPSIFFSHVHDDNELCARIVAELRHDLALTEDDEIFIDLHNLHPGAQFMHKIQTALANHPIFVVALTSRSVRSDFVRSETNYAIQQTISHPDTHLIIPLLLESCEP